MDVKVRNGFEVTVKEQQGWVRHETGDGEMEKYGTCAKNLFGTLEPCVYVHTHEDVRMCADKLCNRKMCVQQVSVCTASAFSTTALGVGGLAASSRAEQTALSWLSVESITCVQREETAAMHVDKSWLSPDRNGLRTPQFLPLLNQSSPPQSFKRARPIPSQNILL